jgi:hypothetical protein
MHGDKPYGMEQNRTEHVPILEIHRHCITTNSYILFYFQNKKSLKFLKISVTSQICLNVHETIALRRTVTRSAIPKNLYMILFKYFYCLTVLHQVKVFI